jgi:hypothetical protein
MSIAWATKMPTLRTMRTPAAAESMFIPRAQLPLKGDQAAQSKTNPGQTNGFLSVMSLGHTTLEPLVEIGLKAKANERIEART